MFGRRLTATGLILCVLATAAVGADPAFYTKKATWHETMYAACEALAKPKVDDGKLRIQLGTWYVTPPIRTGNFAKGGPPEKGIDLQARHGGKPLWKAVGNWPDGNVHKLGVPGNSAFYLYRTITASKLP